jgi:hypothetical protein
MHLIRHEELVDGGHDVGQLLLGQGQVLAEAVRVLRAGAKCQQNEHMLWGI